MIKRDIEGVEGFPYRLLIISAVLALTLPVIYSTWEYYDRQSTLQDVREEVEFIGQKAEQLFIRGINNSARHEVELDDGLFTNIEYVELGGEYENWIEWEAGGQEEAYQLPRNISLIPETEDETIRLTSGSHTLFLETKEGNIDEVTTRYIGVEEI